MEINWLVIEIVAFFIVILIVYIIRKNQKDKKKLTKFLNQDYKKKEESELNDEDEY